jgi:hypothetical protein
MAGVDRKHDCQKSRSFDLPDTPWLRLDDAIHYLIQGKESAAPEVYECALVELERRLTEAAFAERLRFRGIRNGGAALAPRNIDASYFAEPRGFVGLENQIGGHPYSNWYEAIADKQADPGWHGARRHPDPTMVLSPSAGRGELWLRLRSGELIATGIHDDRKVRVAIPKHDWIDLAHFEQGSGGFEAIGVEAGGRHRYDNVQVARDDVFRLWDAMPPALFPVEEQMRCIAERSAVEFGEPFWTVWLALSWIAFRDQKRLCLIENRRGFKQAVLYRGSEMLDRAPNATLLGALRRDEIRAIDQSGSDIPAARWAFARKVPTWALCRPAALGSNWVQVGHQNSAASLVRLPSLRPFRTFSPSRKEGASPVHCGATQFPLVARIGDDGVARG